MYTCPKRLLPLPDHLAELPKPDLQDRFCDKPCSSWPAPNHDQKGPSLDYRR